MHDSIVKEKVAAPHSIEGNCPKFVGLGGTDASNPKFKRWSVSKDDEYCEKNCRAGFCPETKCRCSTDLEPESSDDRADDPASVLPVAPTPIAVAPVVAPTAPVAPEAAPAPLIATDQDSCPKYIALSGSANVKSKFNQVDDGWCDKNCRGNYLSCPKDKCRCFNEDHPEGSLVGDDAMIASAHAADKAAINSTPGLATSEEEALGGNCPKFVSIGGTNNDNTDFVNFGGVSKVQGHQVDNEYCEKNCRAGFCPETKCRCTTDPDLQSSDEGA
jgi:hypothetical protein